MSLLISGGGRREGLLHAVEKVVKSSQEIGDLPLKEKNEKKSDTAIFFLPATKMP